MAKLGGGPHRGQPAHEYDECGDRFAGFQTPDDQVEVDLELAPLWDIHGDHVILTGARKIHVEHDTRSAPSEDGSHRIGTVAKRRVARVIDHEKVEGLAGQLRAISA